jgi:N-acetylglucosaminyldiphosphoundecaprenol N-acetyl-beta-D-mannosaminyltransferase
MPSILGVNITASNYAEVVKKCTEWAAARESRTVVFADAHVIMQAHDRPTFRDDMNAADLANPDGMPIVWACRAFGAPDATRVYGPDATLALLAEAEKTGLPVGFYGGTDAALAKLLIEVKRRFPGINVAFHMSPPFRPLTDEEDQAIVRQICDAGVRWLFVGLGCPKQERWIMAHKGRIPAVLLAVGAAFDFIAGTKPQAPRWMMRNGLEWAFRLGSEPRRLAGRYFKTIPRFMALIGYQWVTRRNLAKAS